MKLNPLITNQDIKKIRKINIKLKELEKNHEINPIKTGTNIKQKSE